MKALITIQVTEKEAIQIGSQRWSEKYLKRAYLFLGIGAVGAVLIMIALPEGISNWVSMPVAIILSITICYPFFRFLKKAQKEGKQFLKNCQEKNSI